MFSSLLLLSFFDVVLFSSSRIMRSPAVSSSIPSFQIASISDLMCKTVFFHSSSVIFCIASPVSHSTIIKVLLFLKTYLFTSPYYFNGVEETLAGWQSHHFVSVFLSLHQCDTVESISIFKKLPLSHCLVHKPPLENKPVDQASSFLFVFVDALSYLYAVVWDIIPYRTTALLEGFKDKLLHKPLRKYHSIHFFMVRSHLSWFKKGERYLKTHLLFLCGRW